MNIHSTPISCGILVLWDLWGEAVTGDEGTLGRYKQETTLESALRKYEEECARQGYLHPIVIFSDASYGEGKELAEGLMKYGSVQATPYRKNPNTRNNIKMWTWPPSRSYMQKVAKRTGANL